MMCPPCDHRQDDGLVCLEVANGCFLVGTHERAIAGDIGRENSGQFTFKVFGHARVPAPMHVRWDKS